MINGQRVVAFTPYGRRKTVSILFEYMKRDHDAGILDEWWLCLNTDPDQQEDIAYAYLLAGNRSWIKLQKRPTGVPRMSPKQRNTGYFYRYMTDPNTMYLRFDDDMVYVHPDAITNLVEAKQKMTSTLACFPIIWNNAVVTWFLQKHGKYPTEHGEVEAPYCMDPVGWADGEFAVKMHEYLLDELQHGGDPTKVYLYQDVPLPELKQFSVSCFALDGKDLCTLTPPGHLDYEEEEHWLTVHRPQLVGKDNVIVGSSLVSHYTFYPQQRQVFQSDVLDRYRELARKVNR